MRLPPLVAYDLLVGILATIGLTYLLFVRRARLRYRPSIVVLFVGLLVFVLSDPLLQLLYPSAIHFAHGVAAVLVAYGLYDPIHGRLRHEEWSAFLLRDPSVVRSDLEWMTPMDDHILWTLRTSRLVLSPSIIALNIDRSREAVSRRLNALAEQGLVERVDRGKYRIAPVGEQYLEGKAVENSGDSNTRYYH